MIRLWEFVEFLLQVCLELGFHLVPAKIADVEFLHRVTFLLAFGFELQCELTAYQTEVSVALCAGHHPCV